MKILSILLSIVGIALLVIAVIGRFTDNPHTVLRVAVVSIVTLANTALLLGILTKLYAKK